jgi:predicted nucleic acid-binding Zn ribbon protein
MGLTGLMGLNQGQGRWQGKRGGRRLVGVSQVLEGLLDRAGLGHLFYEEKLRGNWAALMGPKASGMASLESLKGWTLKVRVESATWRMELHYQRDSIRKRANEILGADLVKDVMLV